MATITSIGIGNMGAALATALLKSSSPPMNVTIWNRTASRPQVQSLISAGAIFEPSLAAALASSEVILLCLLDYPAISSVFSQVDASAKPLAGKTILNLTNGTPKQARDMEAFFKSLGAAVYFDGGVMVTPQLVGTPAAFVVLSGETEQAYNERLANAGLLSPVGAVLYIAPDPGAASLVDCAALAAMYGMFIGAFTGIGLLKRQKHERDGEAAGAKAMVDKVMVPVLTALVPYVGLLAEQVDKEAWMDDLGNPLAMQAEGVRNIMQSCEDEGVDGTGLKFLSKLMEKGVKEGFGPGGVAVVAKYLMK
ncbi:ComE operon protein 4 [Madurella mycetomatis]|uniref:ComE operon protein 4 n=1 Tax=Madurella mycetomatis TaxID=100816 RepID=A0A175WBH2_9PEZI|nr:ComE operon protein 4 [Madurella mycetomatis]